MLGISLALIKAISIKFNPHDEKKVGIAESHEYTY